MLFGDTTTTLFSLLICTSFIRLLLAFTVLRYGIGLFGAEISLVGVLVSATLALFSAPAQLTTVVFTPSTPLAQQEALEILLPPMKEKIAAANLRVKLPISGDKNSGDVFAQVRDLAPQFVVAELKSAATIGCYVLLPFLLIDLVVAHLLTLIGALQISAHIVTLPMKLLLFLSIGGWELFFQKVLS